MSDSEEDYLERSSIHILPPSRPPFRLHLLTLLSAVGGFLFGYDTGVVSGAMVLIRKEFELSNLWQELIVSSTVLAACLTSLLGSFITDRFGRRRSILFSSNLFLFGSVMLASAPAPWALLLGRLVVGAGVGIASSQVPLYISECSTAELRGRLVTMNNVAITGGQLTAGLVCGGFATDTHGWRIMLGIAALPAAFQFFGFFFMPESPRFLVAKEKLDEAERVLRSIRSSHHNIQDELEDIAVACRSNSQDGAWLRMMSNPQARLALIMGCLLQAIQQFAGINTVMYYSASIMAMTGLPDTTSIWMAAVTSSFNFLFTILGIYLVTKCSRRFLLFTSISVVIMSLLAVSGSFYYISFDPTGNFGPGLALFSICLYLAGFAPGLGTLPWTINSELHPSWCRAEAVSVATSTNWITNFIVSATFLSLANLLGKPLTFLLYASLTAFGTFFLARYLPETKGVPLEQAEQLFTSSAGESHYTLIADR